MKNRTKRRANLVSCYFKTHNKSHRRFHLGSIYRRWRQRMNHTKLFLARICPERNLSMISENDYYRLLRLLGHEKKKGRIKRTLLVKFRRLLKRLDVRPIRLVQHDMITMNSRALVSTDGGKIFDVHLVYPDQADRVSGRISIFSWLGMCLIGKRKGDRIRNNLTVHEILYQPESRSHFHL